METITIDGIDEDEFRRQIEASLRSGDADGAAERLRALLTPLAIAGGFLPPDFLHITAADLTVTGWAGLAGALARTDRGERRVSALGFHLVEPAPPEGSTERLLPLLETTYYTDDAYPFSDATRDDLLDGYSKFGCQWQGDCEAADQAIGISGLDGLLRAIQHLEAQLLATDTPSDEGIRAGTLAACLVSVLTHQALRDAILREGLPRPLCVMAGEDGLYPCFDAPVISSVECVELGVAAWPSTEETRAPAEEGTEEAADFGMFGLVSRRGTKQPVLVLDEAEAHAAAEVYELAVAQQVAAPGALPSYNPFANSHPFTPGWSEPQVETAPEPEPEAEPAPFAAEAEWPFEQAGDEHGWDAPLPAEPEPTFAAPLEPEPEAEPQPPTVPGLRAVSGHSLRARVVQPPAEPIRPANPLMALWRRIAGLFTGR